MASDETRSARLNVPKDIVDPMCEYLDEIGAWFVPTHGNTNGAPQSTRSKRPARNDWLSMLMHMDHVIVARYMYEANDAMVAILNADRTDPTARRVHPTPGDVFQYIWRVSLGQHEDLDMTAIPGVDPGVAPSMPGSEIVKRARKLHSGGEV